MNISRKASDPKQLCETILKISKCSKEELAEMGRNALKCYQSEFEREKLINQLELEFQKKRFKKKVQKKVPGDLGKLGSH